VHTTSRATGSRGASLIVVGAGGHAKVVIATAHAAGYSTISVHDDDPATHGRELCGVAVAGGTAEVLAREDALVVLAIGGNATRRRLAAAARCRFAAAIVHPHAWVEPSVTLGAGTVVFAGAVIQPDATIGPHAIINTGATIDHDCQLAAFVHVAPGAHLAGNVTLDEGVFLGIGSAVIPGRRIGAWTTVGAGGVVVDDLPAHATAIGTPARPRSP
jgi:sugar O-acyltransferase (sialic acid O-acetyltransferase NeuD family)